MREDVRYSRLTFTENAAGAVGHGPTYPPPPSIQQQSSQPFPNQTSTGQYQPYRPQSSYAVTGASQTSLESGQYPPPPPQPTQGYGAYPPPPPPLGGQSQSAQGYGQYPPPPPRPQGQPQGQSLGQVPYFPPPPPNSSRDIGAGSYEDQGHHHHMERYEEEAEDLGDKVRGRFEQGKQHMQDQYLSGNEHHSMLGGHFQDAGIQCQIVRSCTQWSHGVETEHSIANAYISVIENSQHFVYIENQFFITANSDAQQPVNNKIGAAIVNRILRAARAGQKFKVIVIMPAVPGFAGDLKDDSALGTRAIMEFQYNSINRGGHSIMEMVGNAGYNPMDYIRFYNLRNYDRINIGASMRDAEQRSGVSYEDARNEHDQAVELPADLADGQYSKPPSYQAYSQATDQMNQQQGHYTSRWDSVSECYMLGGPDLRTVPWVNGNIPEIDAFVSEELYIHSKVCDHL